MTVTPEMIKAFDRAAQLDRPMPTTRIEAGHEAMKVLDADFARLREYEAAYDLKLKIAKKLGLTLTPSIPEEQGK